jgi:hypothetical protein
MVKLTGPMMSIDASGTFADTLTFSKWKGRNYARQRVIPENPKTAKQSGVRGMMKFLAQAWTDLVAGEKDDYDAAATARNISAYNEYISQNLARWQMFKSPSKNSPAEEASTPLTITTCVATGGVGHVSLVITPSGATAIWGYALFRDVAEIVTPAWTNCVAAFPADGANPVTFVDSPLAAGTYHYRVAAFNDDGILGTVKADQTADVT